MVKNSPSLAIYEISIVFHVVSFSQITIVLILTGCGAFHILLRKTFIESV